MGMFELQKHRVYGLVLGLVTNNKDPERLGRVKVKYHMLDQQVESDWCRLVSFYAGKSRGAYWVPEVDDEVVLGFEHGDVNFPYIIGSVWNGKDKPKDEKSGTDDYGLSNFADDENDRKIIHSRSGHLLVLDDTKGKEKIVLADASRKNVLTMDVKNKSITLDCLEGDYTVNVPKGTMTINAKNMRINVEEDVITKVGRDTSWKTGRDMRLEADKNILIKSGKQWSGEAGAGLNLKAAQAMSAEAAQITEKASGFFVMKGSIIKLN